ncbi:MAG TPA: hypothetical protein VEW45_03390, partial [Candidatus Dormibacteraeota bacterium]|nr:hypothetical protein [Candidatus Dormibacteraeota bacterium]
GAVLVGIGVLLIALSVHRVARDARSLSDDAKRLLRLTETELPAILGDARERKARKARKATADQAFAIEQPSAVGPEAVAAPRSAVGPVQSANARED